MVEITSNTGKNSGDIIYLNHLAQFRIRSEIL